MAEKTEVGAKLVLDDHATKSLEKIKSGFEHVGEKVTEVQHEMGGLLKQALATAVGFQFSASIDSLKELGMEAINAASGTEEQVKALAGLISMTDKTGMSYEETLKRGEELKNQLEGIGVNAGASADSVVDAFSMIAERSSKSTEEVTLLTEQLAMAGRGVGGIQNLSSAYAALESGIVRPKNALVMLMRQTGIVSGSAKEVAKGLSEMMASGEAGKAKAFELAEQAVARMAAKMKDAPLTFKETVEGLKILRENIFEALGGPMLKAITPALEGVKKYIQTHKVEIEHFAETMGTKVGTWVTEAAKKISEGFEYLKTHADEIEKAIVQGATALKDTVAFMIAHKEEIAIAYGAKAAAPAIGGAASAGKAAWGIAGAAGGAPMLGLAGGGAAAGAVALGVFAIAIVAVAAAAWQANKLMDELPSKHANAVSRMEAMQKSIDSGNVEWMQHHRDMMVTEAPEMIAQANAMVEATKLAAKSNRDFTAAVQTANVADDAQTLANQFGLAASLHKEGQMELAAKTIAGNQNVLDAMHKTGMDFGTAGEELAKTLEKVGQHAASLEVLDILDKQKKAAAKAAAPLPINFTGPITIKQDFRDQDPDRIAVIFRRDLAKNATNAMGAKTNASPFGAL